MTKATAMLLMLIALASSAQAQQRVFVSAHGLDTNPCTVTQPCRTFQQAHNTAVDNGEIDVIDPAGYGPVTISKGISIQAHGFGGITSTASCNTCAAITVAVNTGDPVTLNGLLLDGAGVGGEGILVTSDTSVQILNSVVRHFQSGIYINTTAATKLLIQDTISSDNSNAGIIVSSNGGGSVQATLNRITANNNVFGVFTDGNSDTTIANSVMSNNSNSGVESNQSNGITLIAKNVITHNLNGVNVQGGAMWSYGDNYIRDNSAPVAGILTPIVTQ
jgi:Right handed beta helix region